VFLESSIRRIPSDFSRILASAPNSASSLLSSEKMNSPKGESSFFPRIAGYGIKQRLSHNISSSLSSRLGTQISFQGAAWRGTSAGSRDHPTGMRRDGRDDRPWRAFARSRPHVRRDTLHVCVSDFVRRAKGRSSRKIQQEFEHIRKRYWDQRFWQRGYFSTTSGNITDDTILRYLNKHGDLPPESSLIVM
jgi:hypothetical protein